MESASPRKLLPWAHGFNDCAGEAGHEIQNSDPFRLYADTQEIFNVWRQRLQGFKPPLCHLVAHELNTGLDVFLRDALFVGDSGGAADHQHLEWKNIVVYGDGYLGLIDHRVFRSAVGAAHHNLFSSPKEANRDHPGAAIFPVIRQTGGDGGA